MNKNNIIQPEGNFYNKYASHNPIVKLIINNFFLVLSKILKDIEYHSIYEAGCGEGYVTNFIYNLKSDLTIIASDISTNIIDTCKKQYPFIYFEASSIYSTKYKDNSFDLVVSCEVLEHLENPEIALQELLRITKKYLLLSVPNEPIWRICNLLRFKYVQHLGNSPGHIQHWSTCKFVEFIYDYCKIIKIQKPFPWTMLLCQKQ